MGGVAVGGRREGGGGGFDAALTSLLGEGAHPLFWCDGGDHSIFFHGGGLFSTPSLEHHVASAQSPSFFSLCHQSSAGPDLNTQPAPWS